MSPQGWWLIVTIACATAVPLAAFYRGIAAVGPSTASILLTVEPALTVVLAAMVLGERLGVPQLLGGGLILCAGFILQWKRDESWTAITSAKDRCRSRAPPIRFRNTEVIPGATDLLAGRHAAP